MAFLTFSRLFAIIYIYKHEHHVEHEIKKFKQPLPMHDLCRFRAGAPHYQSPILPVVLVPLHGRPTVVMAL